MREGRPSKFWAIVCVAVAIAGTFLLIRARQAHLIADSDDEQVDFTLSLEARANALVCPTDLLLDHTPGHDGMQMLKVSRQMFGREKAAAKLGCEFWNEGRAVELWPDSVATAVQLQRDKKRGLVMLNTGEPVPQKMTLNCDLQNRS